MPIIASSAFNKRLVEKVQKYRSEYAESHWKVWSQIAAEMSQEDGKTYVHMHLSKHFRNKLIPHLDSYALDEELINQLQYPYLRRVYHIKLCFHRAATQREDNVENITDNKLFIRYMTNGNVFDHEILQLFKRRGCKASQMRKILINVSDPAYALPDHIQVHLVATKRLFRGKFLYNGQRWVAPHAKPTPVSRPCEGSLIALDGELVRIENCTAGSVLSSPYNLLEKESLVINTQEFEKMCHENSQPPDFEKLSLDSAFAADLSNHSRTQPEKDPLTVSSFMDSSRSITPDRSQEQSAISLGSSNLSAGLTLSNECALDGGSGNGDNSSGPLSTGESFNEIGISNVEYEDTMQSINSSRNTTDENNLEPELPNDDVVVPFFTEVPGDDDSLVGEEEIDANDSPDGQMVSPPNISRAVEDQSEPSPQRTRLGNSHSTIKQELVTNTIDPQVDLIVLDTSSDGENDAENLATPLAKDSLSAVIPSRNHGSVEEDQRISEHSSMDTTGETVVEKIPPRVDVPPVPLIVRTGLSRSFFTDPHEGEDSASLSEEDSDASDSTDELMVSPNDDQFNKTNLSREVEDQSEPSTKRIRLDNSHISIKQEVVTNAIDPQVDAIVLDTSSDDESDAENSAPPHAKDSLSTGITARIHGSANENQRNSGYSSMNTTGKMVVEKIPPRVDVPPVPLMVCPVTPFNVWGISVSFFTDPLEDEDGVSLSDEDSDASGSSEEQMVHENTTPNSLTHERSNVSDANPVVEDQLEDEDAASLSGEDNAASDSSEEQMVHENTTPNSLTHERSNVSDANPVVEDQLEDEDAASLSGEDNAASDSSEELMVHDNTTPNSLIHERSNVSDAHPVVEDQLEGDAMALGEEDNAASDSSEQLMVPDNTTPNSLTHERSNVSDANPVVEDQSAELSAKAIELSTVANSIEVEEEGEEQEGVATSTTDHAQEEEWLSGQSVVSTYFETSSQLNSADIQPPEIVCDSSSPIESGAETGHNRENTLSDGGDTDNSPAITAAQPPMDQHKTLPSEQIDHPVGIRNRNELENTPMQDVGDESDMVRSTTLVALVRSRLDDNLLLHHEILLQPMIMSKRKLWQEMRKSLPQLFVKQPDEAAAHGMSLLICHKLCLIRLVSEGLKREYCISAKLETVMSIAAQLACGTPDITKFLT